MALKGKTLRQQHFYFDNYILMVKIIKTLFDVNCNTMTKYDTLKSVSSFKINLCFITRF